MGCYQSMTSPMRAILLSLEELEEDLRIIENCRDKQVQDDLVSLIQLLSSGIAKRAHSLKLVLPDLKKANSPDEDLIERIENAINMAEEELEAVKK